MLNKIATTTFCWNEKSESTDRNNDQGFLRIGFGKTVKVEQVSNIDTAIPVDHINTPENKAAILIQKHLRGFFARRSFLPTNLHSDYRRQCKKAKGPDSETMPQARGGKTTVFLPEEMPGVVLKRSGKRGAIARFHQMREVRSILNSQNSSNLVIPKARRFKNFLVEERLPINVCEFHNMEIYISEPHLFDEAVREMTRLFSIMYLGDLFRGGIPIGGAARIRYDNLPLYIVEKNGKRVGKIGLIDLESIQKLESRDNLSHSKGLKTLAIIFPYHLDAIIEEANNLNMEFNEKALQDAANEGKKFLQVGFSNHLKWLQKKGISSNTATQIFEISSERMKELTNVVEKELVKINQGINDLEDEKFCLYYTRKTYGSAPPKNFFTEEPENLAKEFATIISPMIVENIKSQIKEKQKKKLSSIKGQTMTKSEIVNLRSPYIFRTFLHKGVDKLIYESPKIKFRYNVVDEDYGEIIAKHLTHVIIDELIKGGELFFFDPAYYLSSCWLRY